MGLFSKLKEALFCRKSKTPALGLALGSGGAKGMAHLGVLKAFEEEEIKFSFVTGTSIGSIAGALYAKGCTSSDMVQIIEGISRKEFSKGLNPFTEGSFAENFLSGYFGEDFSSLSLPFAAWATDGETNEGVLLKSGNLPRALAASSAMPPYFRGVEIGGKRLYDGAFTNSIPCDVCKDLGAKFVVGVDLSAFQKPDEERGKISRFVDTALSKMSPVKYTKDCKSRGYAACDFMLRPNLKDFRATDVTREAMRAMYQIGYTEAKRNMQEIVSAIKHCKRK